MTDDVSLMAVPAKMPNASPFVVEKPSSAPSAGKKMAASMLKKKMTEIACATSSSSASMTGAVAAMADAPADSVVLFKFCFVDFNGGDYDNELDTYLDYVAEVADAAEARGVSLILGTALPKVAGETTLELVAELEAGRRGLAASDVELVVSYLRRGAA